MRRNRFTFVLTDENTLDLARQLSEAGLSGAVLFIANPAYNNCVQFGISEQAFLWSKIPIWRKIPAATLL